MFESRGVIFHYKRLDYSFAISNFCYGQCLDIYALQVRLSCDKTTIFHCFVSFRFFLFGVCTFLAICSSINLN